MYDELEQLLPNSGLAFIATEVTAPSGIQVPLGPEAIFRRCKPAEINKIKEMISQLGAARSDGSTKYDFLTTVSPEEQGGTSSRVSRLPPEEARYFGIELLSSTAFTAELRWALNLGKPRLVSPFQIFYPEPNQRGEPRSYSWFGNSIDTLRSDDPSKGPAIVTEDALRRVATIRSRIERIPKSAAFIRSSLARHDAVLNSRSDHGLLVVGLFSIIEGLITHRPRLKESLDSIGHQIRSKLTLLQRRFDFPINADAYFPNAKSEKLWPLLYTYRSCIAHGDEPDYGGKLKPLGGPQNVTRFLVELIRELAITCINDPTLVADLKEC